MAGVVIDTNVAVVANGKTPQAGIDCVLATIETLAAIRAKMTTLVDNEGLIIEEYRRYLSPSGQPGPGDAFFKWLWDNQANPQYCQQIPITPTKDRRRFVEFPESPLLEKFDDNDRKFVAVALASGQQPPVLNASDTDWWQFRQALEQHGVVVQFICPELMK